MEVLGTMKTFVEAGYVDGIQIRWNARKGRFDVRVSYRGKDGRSHTHGHFDEPYFFTLRAVTTQLEEDMKSHIGLMVNVP